jgi:hypothetical protein
MPSTKNYLHEDRRQSRNAGHFKNTTIYYPLNAYELLTADEIRRRFAAQIEAVSYLARGRAIFSLDPDVGKYWS